MDSAELLQLHLLFIIQFAHALCELILDFVFESQDVLAFVICVRYLWLEIYLGDSRHSYVLVDRLSPSELPSRPNINVLVFVAPSRAILPSRVVPVRRV